MLVLSMQRREPSKRPDFQELGRFPLGLALPPLLVETSSR
jgi:hypothetical protein